MLLNLMRVEDVEPEYLLRASFHQMSAAERDEIVSKLLAIGLIRQEGKFLMQNAA